MNIQECNILLELAKSPYKNQRTLAKSCRCSLGTVNQSLRRLSENGYIDAACQITKKAEAEFNAKSPKNAVILAAGTGLRMIPINLSKPKGLIEIYGEPLIERLIKQLHEAGIYDITIIVGFMKEHHEYLIDKYNVELIVNPEYYSKNNLHTLALALKQLSNTYIIPCDIWCKENPFCSHELYSWYMVSDALSNESPVRVNRKMELVSTTKNTPGNTMIGISYLLGRETELLKSKIVELCLDAHYNYSFWEEALISHGKMITAPKIVSSQATVEINTYEQLREFDTSSNQLESDVISMIAEVLDTKPEHIKNISVLKKGMTNRSFTFDCGTQKYIMRIPGEGTRQLINREHEASVYQIIKDTPYCDELIYINPKSGHKITKYWKHSRTCHPMDQTDIRKCMTLLNTFHRQKLVVDHEFDIFGQIQFYESLWGQNSSSYPDYEQTKKNVFSLQPYIEMQHSQKTLTHLDAVPDNFLFVKSADNTETVHLIDWEYAGMQDPHVDIAMFCIYAMYDREMIDFVIDTYFQGNCPDNIRIKIYCYISACGLLWSNWCEYKQQLGVEFGEYSLRQYRYAKVYCQIAKKGMDSI